MKCVTRVGTSVRTQVMFGHNGSDYLNSKAGELSLDTDLLQ